MKSNIHMRTRTIYVQTYLCLHTHVFGLVCWVKGCNCSDLCLRVRGYKRLGSLNIAEIDTFTFAGTSGAED